MRENKLMLCVCVTPIPSPLGYALMVIRVTRLCNVKSEAIVLIYVGRTKGRHMLNHSQNKGDIVQGGYCPGGGVLSRGDIV